MSRAAKRAVDVESCYPEWLIVLAGRIVAAVKAGEFGRLEVAQLIAQSIPPEAK